MSSISTPFAGWLYSNSATPPPTPGEINLLEVTYAQLSAAITWSTLIPWTWYKITDYETIHEVVWTGQLNTAFATQIEPIIVLSTDVNKLSPVAYSTLHEQDVLWYDPTSTTILGTPTKGSIRRRINTERNVSVAGDARYALVARWDADVTADLGIAGGVIPVLPTPFTYTNSLTAVTWGNQTETLNLINAANFSTFPVLDFDQAQDVIINNNVEVANLYFQEAPLSCRILNDQMFNATFLSDCEGVEVSETSFTDAIYFEGIFNVKLNNESFIGGLFKGGLTGLLMNWSVIDNMIITEPTGDNITDLVMDNANLSSCFFRRPIANWSMDGTSMWLVRTATSSFPWLWDKFSGGDLSDWDLQTTGNILKGNYFNLEQNAFFGFMTVTGSFEANRFDIRLNSTNFPGTFSVLDRSFFNTTVFSGCNVTGPFGIRACTFDGDFVRNIETWSLVLSNFFGSVTSIEAILATIINMVCDNELNLLVTNPVVWQNIRFFNKVGSLFWQCQFDAALTNCSFQANLWTDVITWAYTDKMNITRDTVTNWLAALDVQAGALVTTPIV